jgi:protein TonB
MSETGFFAQKQRSPAGLTLVILLHAALIAAVILVKGPAFQRILHPPIDVTLVPITPDPPPDHQPPPRPDQPPPEQHFDQPPPLNQIPSPGPTAHADPGPTQLALNEGTGTIDVPVLPPPPPPPIPVRRAAQIDPSSQLQPPYPPSEQRAERDGRVQVRVTIGPDGRVIDVTLVSATSDAFWLVTRQQALRHWRFRPATVDGRPVEEGRVPDPGPGLKAGRSPPLPLWERVAQS